MRVACSRSFLVSLLSILIIGAAGASASVDEGIEILCQAAHPDDARQRTGCRKRQVDAAGKLGSKLEKSRDDPEIKLIFDRCAKPHRMEQGAIDWYLTNLCFNREMRPYRSFQDIAKSAQGDTFTTKVLAFCREKRTHRVSAFTWRDRDRCRRLQTVAGEDVANLYQGAPAGSSLREGMDSCAREHRTKEGRYDWTTVKRCIQAFMRR